MTDIEKKAREYAELQLSGMDFDNEYERTCELDNYRCAFLAGAAYALGNQWRDAEKEKPEDGEYVLIYHSEYGIEPSVWNEKEQCWDDAQGDDYMYSAETVDAWMEIPEYKPKEEQ